MAKEFDLQGVKEFDKLLDSLDPLTHAKLLQDFNVEVAKKTVLPELKNNCPVGDDRLYNDLKVRKDKADKTGVFVGNTTDTFWARFYEFGTVTRVTKKGTNRGKIEPKPFIEKSIDSSVPNALKYFSEKFGERMHKILKRNVKRINKKNSKR